MTPTPSRQATSHRRRWSAFAASAALSLLLSPITAIYATAIGAAGFAVSIAMGRALTVPAAVVCGLAGGPAVGTVRRALRRFLSCGRRGSTRETAMTTTILGYPRIGARRELKFATEDYWAGRIDAAALEKTGAELRAAVWTRLRDAGLDTVPSNTFSFYDHVLDTSVMVDAVPDRYRHLSALERYFAMARGAQDVPALEMTK
jgi:hypothetical protein